MSIRPEEDPGYFDEFVSDEMRQNLKKPKCAKTDDLQDVDEDCYEADSPFVPPEES